MFDDNTNTITYRDLTVPGILSRTERIIPSYNDPYTFRTDNEIEDESKILFLPTRIYLMLILVNSQKFRSHNFMKLSYDMQRRFLIKTYDRRK